MNKIDDLKWIRIFTPSHIPKYLIEQVRDRDFSIEDFYKYHEINCTVPSEDGLKLNPFSHLYILANEQNEVKGVLWFCVDPLAKDIIIQTFSMDKEYWMKGIAVKKLADHIKTIKKKGKLNKIYWVTNYPKHSERNGFTRCKSVLMEYNEENEVKKNGKNSSGSNSIRSGSDTTVINEQRCEVAIGKNINGGQRTEREHQPSLPGTTGLFGQCARATATTAC